MILCGGEDAVFDFMMAAYDQNMVTDEYAYIYIDIYRRFTLRPWQVRSVTVNSKIMDAFTSFHPVIDFHSDAAGFF